MPDAGSVKGVREASGSRVSSLNFRNAVALGPVCWSWYSARNFSVTVSVTWDLAVSARPKPSSSARLSPVMALS